MIKCQEVIYKAIIQMLSLFLEKNGLIRFQNGFYRMNENYIIYFISCDDMIKTSRNHKRWRREIQIFENKYTHTHVSFVMYWWKKNKIRISLSYKNISEWHLRFCAKCSKSSYDISRIYYIHLTTLQTGYIERAIELLLTRYVTERIFSQFHTSIL